MKKRIILIAAAAVVLLATVATILLVRRKSTGTLGELFDGISAPAGEPLSLEPGDEEAVASAWVEMREPAKLWAALRQNAWAREVLADPLGEGLLGSWAAFLGSRGEDLSASFKGEVATLVAEKLLADPFRLVWYSGKGSTGAPALVVPEPSRTSRAAFSALDEAVRRGSMVAAHCPGPAPKEGEAKPIHIARWLIAEHPVFAGSNGDRIVLSRQPRAVLQGLCAVPPQTERPPNTDVELAFAKDGFGVQTTALGDLAGLGPALRLAFAVENGTLVPRGILGELAAPGRLATAPPPEKLLRGIPEEMGVVVTLALKLPSNLTRASLQAHLTDDSEDTLAERQIALAWNPRGDAEQPIEVAILWSAPPDVLKADRKALRDVFSGPNNLAQRAICGQEVFASSAELLARMERACSGKAPSLLNGPPNVKAGLLAPASMGIGVNLGRLLSGLLVDAYRAEQGKAAAGSPPPEIESARRLLEALPFFGLRGAVQGKALVPGGFRS